MSDDSDSRNTALSVDVVKMLQELHQKIDKIQQQQPTTTISEGGDSRNNELPDRSQIILEASETVINYLSSKNMTAELWTSEKKPFQKIYNTFNSMNVNEVAEIDSFEKFCDNEKILELIKEVGNCIITDPPYLSYHIPTNKRVGQLGLNTLHSQRSRLHFTLQDSVGILNWNFVITIEAIYEIFLAMTNPLKKYLITGRSGTGKSVNLFISALFFATVQESSIIPIYIGDARSWTTRSGNAAFKYLLEEIEFSFNLRGIRTSLFNRYYSISLSDQSMASLIFKNMNSVLKNRGLSLLFILDQVNTLDHFIQDWPFCIVTLDDENSIFKIIKQCSAFFCSSTSPIVIEESLSFCSFIEFSVKFS